MEQRRLLYLKQNKIVLCAENYKALQHHIGLDDAMFERCPIGKAMILLEMKTDSPWYMNARYQDAMAIVHAHGKPDFCVTMTMYLSHPDVLAALLPRCPMRVVDKSKNR